jgi:uncharacterized protein GlcG (DUF336 family)
MVLATSGISTPGAYTTTAELNTGDYQYAPRKGVITLVAKASAVSINAQLSVGGVTVVNDQNVVFIGTSGTITVRDNVIAQVGVNAGSKISLKLRNVGATAGTTCDYMLFFD